MKLRQNSEEKEAPSHGLRRNTGKKKSPGETMFLGTVSTRVEFPVGGFLCILINLLLMLLFCTLLCSSVLGIRGEKEWALWSTPQIMSTHRENGSGRYLSSCKEKNDRGKVAV